MRKLGLFLLKNNIHLMTFIFIALGNLVFLCLFYNDGDGVSKSYWQFSK